MKESVNFLINQFKSVDWFSQGGVAIDDSSISVIASWKDAVGLCKKREQENIQIESRNLLTQELCYKHTARYNQWRNVAEPLGTIIQKIVDEQVTANRHSPKLPKKVLDCIRWDLHNACMELEYADCVPPRFFAERAKWYLAGHFPCGWAGDFPEGRLIVY